MSSKNSGKSNNISSRRSKRKESKKNPNKLIAVSSEDEHSADNSATELQSKRLQVTSDIEAVNKKARTFSEKDMEIDLSSPSSLALPSQGCSQTDASNSTATFMAAMLISTQVQTPILNNTQINHFDSHLPNEETQHQHQAVAPEINSLSPLEQRILNNNDHQQQQHVQGPGPLKSRHDPNNMIDNINDDDYDSDVALRGDVSLYKASTSFADVIRDKESKEACKNRLREYFIDSYNETFINVYLTGKAAVRKLIVILGVEDALTAVCADSLDLLKKDSEAMAPIFYAYDPQAIRIAQKERSITVTDIPLFFSEQDVISAFKQYGTLDSHKFRTPRGANFQKVELTFTDQSVHEIFQRKHEIWTRGHFLRVYSATFNKSDQDTRMEFTAVLKNLPPNINAIDLAQIFSETAASSVGLLRYTESYKSKSWAYFAFTSQDKRDAAMEITCSLKGHHLQWILPSEVKDLCVRYASKDHKTKECDAFEERGRRTIPKNVQNNYARFKPVGYVKPLSSKSEGSFFSRSHSCSHSRSRSRQSNNNNANNKGTMASHNINQQNDNSNMNHNESLTSNNTKNVTYADQVASPSLQTSIHAPHKYASAAQSVLTPPRQSTSVQNKGKDQVNTDSYPVIDQVARDAIIKITKDLNEALHQLATVKSEFARMKSRFDFIDAKLDTIVSLCNTSTTSQLNPSTSIAANIPVNTITKPTASLPHHNTPVNPIQRNIGRPNFNTQRVQTLLIVAPVQTLQLHQPSINNINSNTVDRNEFASAMGKVDQLHNNFNTITAQLASITKFLGGNNTQ